MISPHNPQKSRYSESVVISYSQNQEDVVLHRLRSMVPKGTYVDVGAAHPIYDNVTYALYLDGWRGINVEPMKREANWLREVRPEDITCETAVGSVSGRVQLFAAPDENRGATTADKTLVQRYEEAGQVFEPFTVDVIRLDDLLVKHQISTVHILKIDVEGAERAVIEGASLSTLRPWVLVIEATRPNSTVDVSADWEQMVINAGYSCTLFAGLNKFFVRIDMPEVAKLMSTPANVFDRWKPFEVDDLNQQAEKLQMMIAQISANADFEITERQTSMEASARFAESLVERAERAEEYAASLVERVTKAEEYAMFLQEKLAAETDWVPGH